MDVEMDMNVGMATRQRAVHTCCETGFFGGGGRLRNGRPPTIAEAADNGRQSAACIELAAAVAAAGAADKPSGWVVVRAGRCDAAADGSALLHAGTPAAGAPANGIGDGGSTATSRTETIPPNPASDSTQPGSGLVRGVTRTRTVGSDCTVGTLAASFALEAARFAVAADDPAVKCD